MRAHGCGTVGVRPERLDNDPPERCEGLPENIQRVSPQLESARPVTLRCFEISAVRTRCIGTLKQLLAASGRSGSANYAASTVSLVHRSGEGERETRPERGSWLSFSIRASAIASVS